jgi:hypothetical protein
MSRIETNRTNAQHSTGPKTPEGKRRSSLNALRHGLTGQIVVMPSEDLEAYQRHVKSFTDDCDPKGAIEANLVQSIADTSWRLHRAAASEANLQTISVTGESDQIQQALAMALAQESHARALSNLSIHTQRLARQYEREVAQLHTLQETRRVKETRELEDLLDIMDMYEAKRTIYIPANDGFVFTKPEIDAAKRARNRRDLAKKAFSYRRAAA